MRCSITALFVALATLLLPALAQGRSEHHQFSQREHVRVQMNREAERLDKLRRNPYRRGFILDVF